LADEIKKVGHLFGLDSFPGGLKELLLQGNVIPLDSSTAGIANEDHDVSQDATRPLLNQRGWPWLPFDRTRSEMRILAEGKEHFNGSQQVTQS